MNPLQLVSQCSHHLTIELGVDLFEETGDALVAAGLQLEAEKTGFGCHQQDAHIGKLARLHIGSKPCDGIVAGNLAHGVVQKSSCSCLWSKR